MKKIAIILFILVFVFLYVKSRLPIDNDLILGDSNNIIGDVNSDGKVSSIDYILIKKHILNNPKLTGDELKRADVNNDNNVSSLDYIAVKKAILNGNNTDEKTSSNSIANLTDADKICEAIKNNDSIDYKSFKNVKKDNDDFYVIKAAHACANKLNKPVKVTKDTFHIYNKTTDIISVKTNTDLGNSIIYIHDESGIAGTKYNNNIYKIEGTGCSSKVVNNLGDIKKGSVIGFLKGSENGYYVRINDENQNRKVFIRYGGDANSGILARDAFKVDKNGVILNPLFFSYNNSTVKVYYCKISTNTLTFKNAKILTIGDINTSKSKASSANSKYMMRGIRILRSNTVIDNISHAIVNSSGTPLSSVNHGYYGFFSMHNVADVTLKNSKVYAVKNDNSNINSTYDIIIDEAANITVKNVVAYDYDGSSSYFSKTNNLLSRSTWGMVGTNNVKDITYDGCVLNRIDAHTGVYNLNVKNTKLGLYSFALTGYGTLNIDNVDVYYTHNFINLRDDYGSIWNGQANIKNSTIHPGGSGKVYLIRFKLSYNGNYLHNFGYDLALPNINLDNFKIDSKTSGLYIFNNSSNSTGKVKGNLSKISSHIKNNEFKYYYPKKENIKTSNVKNNSGNISVTNYVINFGEN